MRNKVLLHKGLTIGDLLRNRALEFPGQTAMVFSDKSVRMSYADLDHSVDQVAKSLLSWDINKGDHVAIMSANVPEWVLLQMAVARIGAVFIAINPLCGEEDLQRALKQCDVKALFLINHFKSENLFSAFSKICPEVSGAPVGELDCPEIPSLKRLVSIGGAPLADVLTWKTFLEAGRGVSNKFLRDVESLVLDSDLSCILLTSSSRIPKPIMLTQRGIILNAFQASERMKITYRDKICMAAPFYNGFASIAVLFGGTLLRGATVIIPSEFYDAGATLGSIDKDEATVIIGSPKMFQDIMKKWDKTSYSSNSLRTGLVAATYCPLKIMRFIINDLGVEEMTVAYGLSEASPFVTQTYADDSDDVKFDTVGKPLPGAEVKIIDIESGKTLPQGERGELCTRGDMVMLGYYKAKDSGIDKEGWLHTGDFALQRSDGNYQIIGRIEDSIMCNGEHIFSEEIEKILWSHSDVEDVAVVGVPDSAFGEKICAVIELVEGSNVSNDEIIEFCRAKLASNKIPHYIIFVDELPLTIIGKVQKFKVKDFAIKKLGLVL